MNPEQRLSYFGWCTIPKDITPEDLQQFLTDNSATYVMKTSYHHMVEKRKTAQKVDWEQVRTELQKKRRKKHE